MQYQRYIILIFIVAAILTGLTVQAATVSAFAQFGVADAQLLGLANTTTVASVITGALAFVVLLRHPRAPTFTNEVVAEFAKVTWPDRDDTVKSATTVVATATFVAALLGFYDFVWKNLADLFLFTEG
jgi:preprotein translocase SecE subunit